MSYKNEHYDYIFYRMRECLPTSSTFYYVIVVIKLLPIFLLSQSTGYDLNVSSTSTYHTFFKYFSLSYYIQNSLDISSAITIASLFLIMNIFLIASLLYYLFKAEEVQEIEENYGNSSTSEFSFKVFSYLVFLKYIMLCQYFYEVNFLPLVCVTSYMDPTKIAIVFAPGNPLTFDSVCTGNNLIIFIFISIINFIIDSVFNYFLNSRLFDFNILSDYFWNTYPNFFYSLLFLENLSQIFFVLFLNWINTTYKFTLALYVYFLVFVQIIRFYSKNEFYTMRTRGLSKFSDIITTMVFIATVSVQLFSYFSAQGPEDMGILAMLFFEFVIAILKYAYFHKHDSHHIGSIITENMNKLNDKNVYFVFAYLITQFKNFSDVNLKFTDSNLDIFLHNYVEHLKTCEDLECPCKDYIKKVEKGIQSGKSHYTTLINFTHLKDGSNQEEYILNKFFNVLSANVTTAVKYTNNNVNLNNIKDHSKQKVMYNLRVRLINAVKKLISYRIDYMYNNLDGMLSSNFSSETKHFIRINYFSLQLLCNKSYYKTIFLYQEFLSDFQKRFGKEYKWFLIYYFYLKKTGIKEYNEHVTYLKSMKKEVGISNLDFRSVLSLCTKYYDIEKKLISSVKDYKEFIAYFENESMMFNELIGKVQNFKAKYKNLSHYIRFFFKNDKLNNLFICSKIILFFKIINFDIPESLHNKLVIQSAEDDMRANPYSDTNYYLIANYYEGDFNIKFVSHELLIILEYSNEELCGQDFHFLLPDTMRNLHKDLLINEIKHKNNHNVQFKEIFLVGKNRTCILFDLHFKILLDLKGEITVLCVANLKKAKNELLACFACVDERGSVLTTNREFEEYLILSMKVLDYVQIDIEKVMLQNLGTRIRIFFKDEENFSAEYFEKFDYELYLNTLFGEEFEALRDKNETLYKKKFAKWESLKEMVSRGRYYNRFIDIFVRMRMMKNERYFFVKYLIKSNMNVKSLEGSDTTMSLINAVKMSKKEMAKLSNVRAEEMARTRSGTGSGTREEDYLNIESKENIKKKPENENLDLLNESQSAIQSAASELKNNNSKRLFVTKKNQFKIPQSYNILLLTILLISLCICSIIYNVISLVIKTNLLNQTHDVMLLNTDVYLLKNSLFYLSSGILSIALMGDKIIPYQNVPNNYRTYSNNTVDLINFNIHNIANIVYNINYLNNVYYNVTINDQLATVDNNFIFIFNNGLIYKKNNLTIGTNSVVTYNEISTIHKSAFYFVYDYSGTIPSNVNENLHFLEYIIFNKIQKLQLNLGQDSILSDNDSFLFYLINNLYTQIEPFIETLKFEYKNFQTNVENGNKSTMVLVKIIEFTIILIIIIVELLFVFFGYEKAMNKMKSLKTKIQTNNVDMTISKIEEYIKFSNTFNIYSLYYISDLELSPLKVITEVDKIENKTKNNFQINDNLNSKTIMNINNNNTTVKESGISMINQLMLVSNSPKRGLLNIKAYKENKENNINKERESTELVLLKNLKDPSGPAKTFKDESDLDVALDRGGVGKGLIKLENIKKQRKQNGIYKQSGNSLKTSLKGISELATEKNNDKEKNSSQIASELLSNMDIPNEREITDENSNQKNNNKSLTNTLDINFKTMNNLNNNLEERKITNSNNSNSNERRDSNTFKVKGVLRNNTSTNNNFLLMQLFGSDSNTSNNLNESRNEESNQHLLMSEETNPVNMLKKNAKKIKWTDQNVKRFYSPDEELREERDNQLENNNNYNNEYDNRKSNFSNKGLPTIVENANSSKTLQKYLGNMSNINKIIQNNNNNLNENEKYEANEIRLFVSPEHKPTTPGNDINFSETKSDTKSDTKSNKNPTSFNLLPDSPVVKVTLTPEDINDTELERLSVIQEEINSNEKSDKKEARELKKIQHADFKKMDVKDYKILQNANFEPVRRRIPRVVKKRRVVKNDDGEIEEIVEEIVHSNLSAKIILFLFGLVFLILYIWNILSNMTSFNNMISLQNTSLILLDKVHLLNSLVLKYKFNLITNSTKADLKPQFDNVYANIGNITLVEQTQEFSFYTKTFLLENSINAKSACQFLSTPFSLLFNSVAEYELSECVQGGEEMNKNGLGEAYKNILNTMQQLNTDMLHMTSTEDSDLLGKLIDMSFFDLVIDIEYTMRKYDMLLTNYLSLDFENYHGTLKQTESLFSYGSIVLNVIFALISLVCIILPIKYVETLISWIIHKLLKI